MCEPLRGKALLEYSKAEASQELGLGQVPLKNLRTTFQTGAKAQMLEKQ